MTILPAVICCITNNIINKILEETDDDVYVSLLEGDVPLLTEEMKEDDTDRMSEDATIMETHPMIKTLQTPITIHRQIEI
jgi:hypothetical protein